MNMALAIVVLMNRGVLIGLVVAAGFAIVGRGFVTT